MSTVTELNEKLDALNTAFATERAEVLAKLKEIREALPTGPATQEQIDALGVRLDAAIATAQGIIDAAD